MLYWQFWLILSGIFLLIEIFNVSFLIFWFSIGALIAMLSSFIISNIFLQATIFLVTSTLLLFVTKPFVNKILSIDNTYISKNTEIIVEKIEGVKAIVKPLRTEVSSKEKISN